MNGYVSYRKIMRIIAWVSLVVAVILAVVLFFLVSRYNAEIREKQEELHQLDIEKYEEMKNDDALNGENISPADKELIEKMKNYDFYQKIEEKLDTYVAFFGTETVRKMKNDRTNWVANFFDRMRSNYTYASGINSGSRNSTALYGYVALNLKALQSFKYFDLAVVCYGAYDDPEDFAQYYDGLLRSIKNQNEKCEIYCMIEANPEGYNENAETVRQICELYGGVCIDMNEYYRVHNIDYSTTLNGLEPTALGDAVYLDALMETIDRALEEGRRVEKEKRVNFSTTRNFDNYRFINVSEMKSVGDSALEFSSTGELAILLYKISPTNGGPVRVYVNGKKSLTCDTRNVVSDDFGVVVISNDLRGTNRIRIDTGTRNNVTNIYGVIFGGEK